MAQIERKAESSDCRAGLNMKGVERALDAGVDEVRYVVVASETFNQKNQGAKHYGDSNRIGVDCRLR
ncbi:MAG: hypothetical protein Ct9H300mP14_02740 [Gammaproteobacteria bacterium]|nr:MAG: hypothetical protein Ct9H300mP14_02740 [Gammaproteobacteria bacterium]